MKTTVLPPFTAWGHQTLLGSMATLLLAPLLSAQQPAPLPSASVIPRQERGMRAAEAAKDLNAAWADFLSGKDPQAKPVDPWVAAAQPRILTTQQLKSAVAGPEFQEPQVVRSANGKLTVTLTVALADSKIGPDPVRLRNYNGKLTGPTLVCQPGDTLFITLDNRLEPEPYMPEAMNTLHGFNTTNLHTHGLHVSPSGNSDNVLLQVGPQSVQHYEIKIPPDHPCGTFWYHAHEHGSTAANVGSGMSGALIIAGGIDQVKGLAGIKDRVLVLQQMPYVNKGNANVCDKVGPDQEIGVVEEEYADCCFTPGSWDQLQRYTTINGQQIPVIRVRPGSIERWRFIDSALREVIMPGLSLQEKSNVKAPATIKFQEIAVDGLPLGRLALRDRLELWPGYRSDVLVQIPPEAAGAVYILHDFRPMKAPPPGVPVKPDRKHLAIVMVEGEPVVQALPEAKDMLPFRPTTILPTEVTGRQFASYGIVQRNEKVFFTVDREAFGSDEARQLWLDEVHEWSLTSRNSTNGPVSVSHPFHIHVNPFEIFSITDAAGAEQLDLDPLTYKPIPLWRDTIILKEGWKVMARTHYKDYPGTFVQHCHILDHEDQGMMELVQINENPKPSTLAMSSAVPQQPYTAPDWTLPDAEGQKRPLKELASGPTLIVFYEGFACLRCNDQMQQLITQYDAFQKAGLRVIAISTDSVTDLTRAFTATPCPFPLVADPKLSAFRAYGCAMGQKPMHGIFLLDAQRNVRWQNVSATPYLDWPRVLAEARKLKPSTASTAAAVSSAAPVAAITAEAATTTTRP